VARKTPFSNSPSKVEHIFFEMSFAYASLMRFFNGTTSPSSAGSDVRLSYRSVTAMNRTPKNGKIFSI
jgi:hypothetical protein